MTNKTILLSAGGALALLVGAAAIAGMGDGRPLPFDANADGKVTTAEIDQAAKRRFAAFDVDKDGKLTGAEIGLMHDGRGDGMRGMRGEGRRHMPPPPPAAAQPGDAATVAPPPPMERLLRHDFDGDGAITLAEFGRGMAARYIILDANGDGAVTAEEFKAGRPGHRRGGRH